MFPPVDDCDIPAAFSNSEGTLDARGDLREDGFCRAVEREADA